MQKTELHQEGQLDDFAAAFLDQLGRGFRRASRREKIVYDHDALVFVHPVDVEFQRPLAILEFVFALMALVGELPLFAHNGQADAEIMGQRPAKKEAPRIDGHDLLHAFAAITLGENIDREAKQLAVGEDRRDVLEDNSLLGKVGHIADAGLEPFDRAFEWGAHAGFSLSCLSSARLILRRAIFCNWRMRSRVTLNFLADFFKSHFFFSIEAEAHRDDFQLAFIEHMQQVHHRLAEIFVAEHVGRHVGGFVADHVAERGAVLFLAHGGVEGRGPDRRRAQLRDLARGHVQLLAQFLIRRLSAEFLGQLHADAAHARDLVDQMDRQADGFALVGQRALDRLLDPPRGVGAELAAFLGIEAFDRFHQADVALGDQIEQRQAVGGVIVRDLDDQAQVGLDHLLAGRLVASLDAAGKLHLFLARE